MLDQEYDLMGLSRNNAAGDENDSFPLEQGGDSSPLALLDDELKED